MPPDNLPRELDAHELRVLGVLVEKALTTPEQYPLSLNAATLGANRLQTVWRVILPGLAPAVLTGFALAFARAVGEYGSVIFIAGNIPYVSEIAPLLIVIRLEEFNYAGATAIAAIMLLLSFAMLFVINLIQAWSRRRYGYDV